MPGLRVLYDGWPFRYALDSPASLHLLAILSILPAEIEPILVLPDSVPDWLKSLQLPIRTAVIPTANTPTGLLIWQQRRLAQIARQQGAHLVHTTQGSAPVFNSSQILVSPASYEFAYPTVPSRENSSLVDRLRSSLARGGASQARLLWPDDLPAPGAGWIRARLPPLVLTNFSRLGSTMEIDLPESFVLFHGPGNDQTLRRLVNAWSWVVASFGDNIPLLLIGLSQSGRQRADRLLHDSGLGESVRLLPELSPLTVLGLYQRTALVVHPAPEPPWGGPVRQALAYGRPLVAADHPSVAQMVGASAYLSPADHTRDLGAAMITVLVEERVAEQLSSAAKALARSWSTAHYSRAILELYRRTAGI